MGLGYFDGQIAIGGKLSPPDYSFDVQGISFFENDQWNNWALFQSDTLEGDGLIHGFFEFNDAFYTYGDVTNVGFIVGGQTYNYGFVGLHTTGHAGAIFDKQIRAIEAFQGNVYFAGDFSEVSTGWGGSNGGTYNGLVYSPLTGVSSTEDNLITKKIQVYHASQKLYVNYEDLEKEANLNIYNLQGQVLQTINLQEGSANEIIDLPDWSAGTYIYQIVNNQGQQSGKFGLH